MSTGRNNSKISNQSSGGGNKKQGLAPKATHFFKSLFTGSQYSTKSGDGSDRFMLVCMNQLGGIGRGRSQFGYSADGLNCKIIESEPESYIPYNILNFIFSLSIDDASYVNVSASNLPIINNNNSFSKLQIDSSNNLNDIITYSIGFYHTDLSGSDGLKIYDTSYQSLESFKIVNFGDMPLSKTGEQFREFVGSIDISAGEPTILPNTSLYGCFRDSSIENSEFGNIGNWNTSKVTNMDSMFKGTYYFNQNISTKIIVRSDGSKYIAWDTSKVTTMSNILNMGEDYQHGFGNFNNGDYPMTNTSRKGDSPLLWDLSSCLNIEYAFRQCRRFNQNVSTNYITLTDDTFSYNFESWNTKNVISFEMVFAYCETFNNGDIFGGVTMPLYWNANSCESFYYMFGLYNYFVREESGGVYNQPMNTEPRTINDISYIAWDTSNVTNMRAMFQNCINFDQPLNDWDTSNVTNMHYMLRGCQKFNQSLNNWNTSNVTDMVAMFANCNIFNQPLDAWDTSKVTDMEGMFYNCNKFDQPLNDWDTSNVTNMRAMFQNCDVFNQPLNDWNTSNVTNMGGMFYNCEKFNQPLDAWDTSNVTDMEWMFYNCNKFDQSLNDWNTSNVTNMYAMFAGCQIFNQPLNDWDTSNVTNMGSMFDGCYIFNQPLNDWNIEKVTDMGWMFGNCQNFNQPLNDWNTIDVSNMYAMFARCQNFNQPLNSWNIEKVTNMEGMFSYCYVFDQSLNSWNTSNVTNMDGMFYNCNAYTYSFGNFDFSSITNIEGYISNITDHNKYDNFLIDLCNNPSIIPSDISNLNFGIISTYRTNDAIYNNAYDYLTVTKDFSFNDGGSYTPEEISDFSSNNDPTSIRVVHINNTGPTDISANDKTYIYDSGGFNSTYEPDISFSHTLLLDSNASYELSGNYGMEQDFDFLTIDTETIDTDTTNILPRSSNGSLESTFSNVSKLIFHISTNEWVEVIGFTFILTKM